MKRTIIKSNSIPASILIGAALGLLISIMGALFLAWLINTERVGQGAIDNGVLIILLGASATSAVISSTIVKEKRLLICALSGLCYLLMLLAITALFFGGQYSGIAVSGLVILAGSICVCLLGLMPQKRRNTSRRKMKNR